ncbi:hypothetical protein SAMN06265360_10489 [Haloechinothrix alba]|uniref:Integral membrane protein n=1 Tax=Haloechinothrix alba TaxID=664784 RepID=A0A238VVZ3_9PSEU|nr:hypothetical protein [Haloechinothrix alba]SNR37993.1 hypothetical protein SAMN06265360_10489 [Haloechinothrix alba]
MDFLHQLLLFLHLLGMGLLVGTFLLQLRGGADAPLNKGWLHGSGVMLITGAAMMALDPFSDNDLNHTKLGIKILVLIAIGGLALAFLRKPAAPRWVGFALGGLVVVNVGLAVFWT